MPHRILRHRLSLLGVICAGLLLALAACGDDEGDGGETPAATTPEEESPAAEAPCEGGPGVEGTGETLKIGLLAPFTGSLSTFGPEYENSVNLAAKCINNAGGVNGGEVEIVTGDEA